MHHGDRDGQARIPNFSRGRGAKNQGHGARPPPCIRAWTWTFQSIELIFLILSAFCLWIIQELKALKPILYVSKINIQIRNHSVF